MDLLNRYLNAVAAQLPERQRDSIALELREELLSRMEELRCALHRPLTEREVSGVLKSCGHPLVVAGAYLPQRHLLSPVLLPFYWFVMRVIIGIDLLAHLARVVVSLTFGERAGHVLAVCADSLWIVTMYHIGVITFSALILDRLAAGRLLVKAWSPRWLPGARRPGLTVLALDVACLLVVLWIFSGAAQSLMPAGAARVRPGPVWEQIRLMMVVIALAPLGIHLLQRFTLVFDRGIRLAKVILGALLLTVAAVVAGSRPWFELDGMPPSAAQAVSQALDVPVALGIVAATITALVLVARNGRRLIGALISAP